MTTHAPASKRRGPGYRLIAPRYAHTIAFQLGADTNAEHGFLPERHQVVFDEKPAPEDHDDLVQRLIYRTDLPYRKEYSAIQYPGELNRRPGWLAAVGPYVSVICGHPDFIENAIFLSAVQAVGAAAQLARDPPGRLRRRPPVQKPRSRRRNHPGPAPHPGTDRRPARGPGTGAVL